MVSCVARTFLPIAEATDRPTALFFYIISVSICFSNGKDTTNLTNHINDAHSHDDVRVFHEHLFPCAQPLHHDDGGPHGFPQ